MFKLEMCPQDTGDPRLHRFVNLVSLGQFFFMPKLKTKNLLLSKGQILQILNKSTRKPQGA
jgi:hypothetical protein